MSHSKMQTYECVLNTKDNPVDLAELSHPDNLLELAEEIKTLRQLLWLHNGKDHMLYGDDGEMLCNTCWLDFKRDSFKEIFEKLKNNALEEAIGALNKREGSENG